MGIWSVNMAKWHWREVKKPKSGGESKYLWADHKPHKQEGKRKDRTTGSKTGCASASASEELHRVEGTWLSSQHKAERRQPQLHRRSFNIQRIELWRLLLLCQLLVTAWSLQQAAPSTPLWEDPQLLRLHVQRKYQRSPGAHKPRVFDEKFTYGGEVHILRGRSDNCVFVSWKSLLISTSIFSSLFFLFFLLTGIYSLT